MHLSPFHWIKVSWNLSLWDHVLASEGGWEQLKGAYCNNPLSFHHLCLFKGAADGWGLSRNSTKKLNRHLWGDSPHQHRAPAWSTWWIPFTLFLRVLAPIALSPLRTRGRYSCWSTMWEQCTGTVMLGTKLCLYQTVSLSRNWRTKRVF